MLHILILVMCQYLDCVGYMCFYTTDVRLVCFTVCKVDCPSRGRWKESNISGGWGG